jgi:hypothetical protein
MSASTPPIFTQSAKVAVLSTSSFLAVARFAGQVFVIYK